MLLVGFNIMKTNYSAVIEVLRRIALKNIKLDKDQDYFEEMMLATDDYHPFDSEGEHMLSKALDSLPVRCDYRSVKSYWAWKDGREYLEEAIAQFLEDTEYMVQDHCGNAWNFPPGYVLPERIVTPKSWEAVAEKAFPKIVKAYRE